MRGNDATNLQCTVADCYLLKLFKIHYCTVVNLHYCVNFLTTLSVQSKSALFLKQLVFCMQLTAMSCALQVLEFLPIVALLHKYEIYYKLSKIAISYPKLLSKCLHVCMFEG